MSGFAILIGIWGVFFLIAGLWTTAMFFLGIGLLGLACLPQRVV